MSKIQKSTLPIEILSPVDGVLVPLESVPDPVFSAKLLGNGAAIVPSNGTFYSPIEGEVVHIGSTKHAIVIRSQEGVEVLLHVGIDTVTLNGEGFSLFVQKNDHVHVGTKLIEVDLQTLKINEKNPITPIVITNLDIFEIISNQIESKINEFVEAGKTSLFTVLKKLPQ